MSLTGRDLLGLSDLNGAAVQGILTAAQGMKAGTLQPHCGGKTLGLLFRKASTRTRVSFSVAMQQMRGSVIDLDPNVTQVSRGEPLADTARVLDRYLDVLAIRTFAQEELTTFAHHCRIPIINALTDQEHPCQILADLLTIQENFGDIAGRTVTYIGDGNNIAHSLLLGCALTGAHVRIASPEGFAPNPAVVAKARELAAGTEVVVTTDPKAAAAGADVLYTDVWASMGQEAEAIARQTVFRPYQINGELLALAQPGAIVLHCLPAHREEEITAEVLEGPQSRVWDQAENRLHAQKALIALLLGA